MVADDPFGRRGPKLDEFLSNKSTTNTKQYNNFNQAKSFNNYGHNSIKNAHHSQSSNNNAPFKQAKQQSLLSSGRINSFDNLGSVGDNPMTSSSSILPLMSTRAFSFQPPPPSVRGFVETNSLHAKLLEIFPNLEPIIHKLLTTYQTQTDITFFLDKLLKENST